MFDGHTKECPFSTWLLRAWKLVPQHLSCNDKGKRVGNYVRCESLHWMFLFVPLLAHVELHRPFFLATQGINCISSVLSKECWAFLDATKHNTLVPHHKYIWFRISYQLLPFTLVPPLVGLHRLFDCQLMNDNISICMHVLSVRDIYKLLIPLSRFKECSLTN